MQCLMNTNSNILLGTDKKHETFHTDELTVLMHSPGCFYSMIFEVADGQVTREKWS